MLKFSIANMNKIKVNGNTRTFDIQIPFELEPSMRYPLLIALHGRAGNAKTIEYISQLTKLAKKRKFIVVYPNGYGLPGRYFYSWNAGFCCGLAYEDKSNDIKYIKMLINSVVESYPINKDQIFITGISNGAMMAYALGTELNGLIKGIAPIAGTIGVRSTHTSEINTISTPRAPLSVLIIHGLKDNRVPFNGGYGRNDKSFSFLPVSEAVNFWVKADKCSTIPKIEYLSGNSVIKESFTGGTNGSQVVLYKIIEGSHSWPGGKKTLGDDGIPCNKKICDASEIIWDFFTQIINNKAK